jgi:hypothetical protein
MASVMIIPGRNNAAPILLPKNCIADILHRERLEMNQGNIIHMTKNDKRNVKITISNS